jgi:ASC-1-like (ASCH) protein
MVHEALQALQFMHPNFFRKVSQEINALVISFEQTKDSPRSVRLVFAKKIFDRLVHKCAELYIIHYDSFKTVLRRRCLAIIKPDTYSFVSPIAYKYFSDDNQVMTTFKKVRNYIRHKKAHEKRRRHAESVLFNKTNVCADVISLVVAYV